MDEREMAASAAAQSRAAMSSSSSFVSAATAAGISENMTSSRRRVLMAVAAREVMAQLEAKGRLPALRELAEFMVATGLSDETPPAAEEQQQQQQQGVAERRDDDRAPSPATADEQMSTLIEYCLFARHADSGLPMLARFLDGYSPPALTRYHNMLRDVILNLFDDEDGGGGAGNCNSLCDLVCSYAEQRPGLVPATAVNFVVYRSCADLTAREAVLCRALADCGRHLAPATGLDELRESRLVGFLRHVRLPVADRDHRLLTAFMDDVPGTRRAIDVRHPVDGSTAAHFCVRFNKLDMLGVLVDYGADTSTIQDGKGRTVLELAKELGNYEEVLLVVDRQASMAAGGAEGQAAAAVAGTSSASSSAAGRAPTSSAPAHLPNYSLLSQVQFEKFPEIYFPSAPDLKPSHANEIMTEYLRQELPRILNMDPGLVVLPPPAPVADCGDGVDGGAGSSSSNSSCGCPYAPGTKWAKGWEAEKAVVRAVVGALEQVRRERPQLRFACFHGLRYGCRLPGLGDWETDLDMVVMCCDAGNNNGELQAMLVFEVKSVTSGRDVVRRAARDDGAADPRTKGTRALDQLCNHFAAFQNHVGVDVSPDWATPILALPYFPIKSAEMPAAAQHDGKQNKKKKKKNRKQAATRAGADDDDDDGETSVLRRWDAFLANCETSDDETLKLYSKMHPRLLTRSVLEDRVQLTTWLRALLLGASAASTDAGPGHEQQQQSSTTVGGRVRSSASSASADETAAAAANDDDMKEAAAERRRRAYSTVLAWSVAHCMGVAVHGLSRLIDDRTSEEATKLALLTLDQKRAYDSSPAPGGSHFRKPLLLVGAAGTGKTLVALAKLVRCERDGLIGADRRGLFLTHRKNKGLLSLVERQLRTSGTKFIRVRSFSVDKGRSWRQDLLQTLMDAHASDVERVRFVVLDQLEDAYEEHVPPDESAEMLRSLMSLNCFHMLWVTVNPFDVPVAHCHGLLRYAYPRDHVDETNSSAAAAATAAAAAAAASGTQLCLLDKRIRNAWGIGMMVAGYNAANVSLPVHFGAEPTSIGRTRSSINANGNNNCPAPAQAASPSPSPSAGSVPIFIEYLDGDRERTQRRTLVAVLGHLLQKAGLKDRHIVVLMTATSIVTTPSSAAAHAASAAERALVFLKEVDPRLTSAEAGFCRPGNRRVPSMAPLLVRAAWAGGDIADALTEEDLDRVRAAFRQHCTCLAAAAAASVAPPPPRRRPRRRGDGDDEPCSSAVPPPPPLLLPLLEQLRGLLSVQGDAAQHETRAWLGSLPEQVLESVAFQATLSLVVRYVNCTMQRSPATPAGASPSTSSADDECCDYSFLNQLAAAMMSRDDDEPPSGPSLLRDLITRHRCVSVLSADEAGGYEADVVVVCDFEKTLLLNNAGAVEASRLVSRAKVMAVLLADRGARAFLEQFFGSFPPLLS